MVKSNYSPVNCVILLGETVKAAVTLWLALLSPFAYLFLPFYLLLQGIYSPVQGGKSDSICRKRALLVTIAATAIAQGFFFFSLILPNGRASSTLFLATGLFIQGRWGNISSVARAALSDTVNHARLIFVLPLSFCILSFPWLFMLRTFPHNFNSLHDLSINYTGIYLSVIIAPFVILLCSIIVYLDTYCRFDDMRDKDELHQTRQSNPIIMRILRSSGLKRIKLHARYEVFFARFELRQTRELVGKQVWGWIGGLFYEYGFHSLFYYLVESGVFAKESFLSQSSLFIFYIAGTIFRPIFLSSNRFGIILGIVVSMISVLFQYSSLSPAIWQGGVGFGSGLFLSCFYLHYLTGQKTHDRGKIVGAADSMQTFGELLATFSYALISLSLSFFRTDVNLLNIDTKSFTLLLFGVSIFCFIWSFKKIYQPGGISG